MAPGKLRFGEPFAASTVEVWAHRLLPALARMMRRVHVMDSAYMPGARLDDDHGATRISVALAERGGWLLVVERDGQIVATEHYDDWHRVERRRRLLETRMPHHLARVATALLVLATMTAVPVAAQTSAAIFPEPAVVKKAIDFVTERKGDDATAPRDGFYPEFGHMVTGAGWISFGPGYRHHLFADRAVVDLSTAISWRTYKTAQARFEFPSLASDHLTIGSQALWQDLTQVAYYGAGPDSIKAQKGDYRMHGSNVVVYGTVRSTRAVSLTGRVGWLSRIGLSSSTGPFDPDLPDTTEQFLYEPGTRLERQPQFFHADLAIAADTRNHASYPSRGGLYRAAWASYKDRGDGAGNFAFVRYELEGTHFVPMFAGRSVMAVHGWGVFSTTADGREVPFYLLPSLGGHNTIRAYGNYRFHDRDMVVVNVESRWALMPHVDAALFVDAGNVAPRAADLNLARTGYGVGLRLHSATSTWGRFDVAKGNEGWQFMFRLNDPFRFGRLTQRTAAVPFVP